MKRFTPEDTDQATNPFWAMIGSPNGYGANRLCTDHKVAFGGKGVVAMNAYVTKATVGSLMFMWAEIG